jgi:hypothetical protein
VLRRLLKRLFGADGGAEMPPAITVLVTGITCVGSGATVTVGATGINVFGTKYWETCFKLCTVEAGATSIVTLMPSRSLYLSICSCRLCKLS